MQLNLGLLICWLFMEYCWFLIFFFLSKLHHGISPVKVEKKNMKQFHQSMPGKGGASFQRQQTKLSDRVVKKKNYTLMKGKRYRNAKTCCRKFLIWSFPITSFWSAVDRKQHSRASSRISSLCLWEQSVFVSSDPAPIKTLSVKNEKHCVSYLPASTKQKTKKKKY